MTATRLRHWEALRISSMLTDSYRRMRGTKMAKVRPEKVIRTLQEAGVRFVVMGTHGIVHYRDQPRATQDVDILVGKRDHGKAVEALRSVYPRLRIEDSIVVTRFRDPATKQPVIDLMKPCFPLYQRALKDALLTEENYRIPSLEMALASKYAAMISPNRSLDKKLIDGGDFVNIVKNNSSQIDLEKLARFGQLVYDGGGTEVCDYVEEARIGRHLTL